MNKYHRYMRWGRRLRNKRTSPLLLLFAGILVISVLLACNEYQSVLHSHPGLWEALDKMQTAKERIDLKDVQSRGLYAMAYDDNITGRKLFYDAPESPEEKEDIWVMYQNLNDADKNLYNLFLDLVENRDVEGYESAIMITNKKLDEIGQAHFWDIFHVMCYDHPEYFYLLNVSGELPFVCTSKTSGEVTMFYFEMNPSDETEKEEIEAFNRATEEFMADIDLDAPDDEIALQIHDKLIDLVSYNKELFIGGQIDDSIKDLGYTAYGALVCDSSGRDNYAVCAGYSRAYSHLLHIAGIPSAYISGYAFFESEPITKKSNHAWNVVKLDGKWYEADVTWDDFEPWEEDENNAELMEMLQGDESTYFNTRHYYYCRTTSEMENLTSTNETLFNISGYSPYNPIKTSYHIRAIEGVKGVDEKEAFRNSLVPVTN